MRSSFTRALLGTHDDRRESNQVYLTLAHHANQSVITDNYADREGIGEILGLGGPGNLGGGRRGFLPLLQMRLDYWIPLNLHLSGTLIETLDWRHPESFSLIKRLRQAGLLEMIGSAFSQNIMPFFSDEHNLRQINEELWLYRRRLDWDLETISKLWVETIYCGSKAEVATTYCGYLEFSDSFLGAVKTFWAPERVWDTEKLARALRSGKLLNGGYARVLLDDRLVYAVGDSYQGSAREKFDRENPLELDAFAPWEIAGGLRNIETESPLRGAEKRIGLSAEAGHMCVNYLLPHGWWRLSAEICFSPDYHRLPQHGRGGPLAASTGGWLLSRSLLRSRLVVTCFAMRAARTRQFLRVGFTWRRQNEKAVFLHISNNCGHPHMGGRDGAR